MALTLFRSEARGRTTDKMSNHHRRSPTYEGNQSKGDEQREGGICGAVRCRSLGRQLGLLSLGQLLQTGDHGLADRR